MAALAADSVRLAVSPPNDSAVNDGLSWVRTWLRLGWPTCCSNSASSTLIGAALPAAVVPLARVPVTMMSDPSGPAALTGPAALASGERATAAMMVSAVAA